MKSEVYSWRVSTDTKMDLEREARKAGISVSVLLDRISQEWLLAKRAADRDSTEEQARLHAAADKVIGTISAGKNYSENVRTEVRKRLRKRYGR
jgi:hypothetical protein